jgi:hypothetical protein
MTTAIAHSNETQPWKPAPGIQLTDASEVVCRFLDVAGTTYGRATHYNSRDEQQGAEMAAHKALFELSRSLYAILMAMPGLPDRAHMLGVRNLLTDREVGQDGYLSDQQERLLLQYMCQALPAPRMFKLFVAFAVGSKKDGIAKANNARTRKLVLRTLFNSPRLPLWSVKYRDKLARALTHVWGQRTTSIITSILKRDQRLRNPKEQGILRTYVEKYVDGQCISGHLLDSIGFALGIEDRPRHKLHIAYVAAKKDLDQGSSLPPEVLEGIRSQYHPDVPKERVIELTKGSMTSGQKARVQKRAKAAGVEVEFNPMALDPVELYIYAFEMGMTTEIALALVKKAKALAKIFPARHSKINIIMDCSASMAGNREQKLRPMATALALRDLLRKVGGNVRTCYCGGDLGEAPHMLVRPMGDTALADALIDAMEDAPDAVYVISDGYENAPAGRFAEVLAALRGLGFNMPVYHLNPVMAAEKVGVKRLSPDEGLSTLPAPSPQGLSVAMVRGLIEQNPLDGINMLVRSTLQAGPSGLLKR